MSAELIAIVDFGSQYAQLIARRVREHNVYSVIFQPTVTAEELAHRQVKGIILSGGPASVYAKNAPRCDERIFDLDVPILGICYGMQIASQILGATVAPAKSAEYGRTNLKVLDKTDLLADIPDSTIAWMSHGDHVNELDDDFVALATTRNCPFAAVKHKKKKFYGLQFHPEVTHTPRGESIFRNFLYGICHCAGDWRMGDFAEQAIDRVRSIQRPIASGGPPRYGAV